VICIVLDDLGRSELGCYGGETIPTPNVDRLAAEGMRFTQAYGGHSVCAPSRDVLMTGRHTGSCTLRGNMSGRGVGGSRTVDDGSIQHRVGLAADDVTVTDLLSAEGYATGAMGKWGLGEPGTDAVPTRKGFDTWFGYLNRRLLRAHGKAHRVRERVGRGSLHAGCNLRADRWSDYTTEIPERSPGVAGLFTRRRRL